MLRYIFSEENRFALVSIVGIALLFITVIALPRIFPNPIMPATPPQVTGKTANCVVYQMQNGTKVVESLTPGVTCSVAN